MLRFCGREFVRPGGIEVIMIEERVCFDKNIWRDNRKHFRDTFSDEATVVRMLPVVDDDGAVICYGWQDDEANRELRMLRELVQNSEALQFGDIFPKIKKVVVYGCNELAYYFVKYLEIQQIQVMVSGKYWDLLGYQSVIPDEISSDDAMIIYAESFFRNAELYQRIIRSASVEFECIDRIYEANVGIGKIKDAEGDFEWFLAQIRDKKVAIFGTGAKAQDTYDLLYKHGIDITAFVESAGYGTGKDDNRTLLGKQVSGIEHAISHMEETIFISSTGKNSALGTQQLEIFDYYGYERNRNFFLIDDYTDVPYSNLIHIFRERSVLLAGDTILCRMLKEYLEKVEENHIHIQCVKLECVCASGNDILCIVHPWCGHGNAAYNPRVYRLEKELSSAGDVSYTKYFSYLRAFVIINEYLSRDVEKYTLAQLVPSGILCGAIPSANGNVFVRSIFDRHPNALVLPISDWNDNLFFYCICLAYEKSGNILEVFKNMIDSFETNVNDIFDEWSKFEKSMSYLLSQKEQFTSQELFLIFHIAYAEMRSGKRIEDVSKNVIYWEPHYFDRMDFPFLAKWLESPSINGCTIVMRRDGITSCGSRYKTSKKTVYNPLTFFYGMAIEFITSDTVSDRVLCKYWRKLRIRFEDLKLHPQTQLARVCEAAGIQMSDAVLQTILNGRGWGGIKDFDLKPVFNKYEEYFSEFDRFRISVICSPYQKKYGYVYENCMKFTRKELWEMFLKKFRFQEELQFADETEKTGYYLPIYEIMKWHLWSARKHMLMNDITPEFDLVTVSANEG